MRAGLIAALMSVASLGGSSARAQENDRERIREQAVEIGRQAREQYDEGRWQEARDRYARAESLVHSPVFVLYLARTTRNLGKLIEARSLYRGLSDEVLPADAPAPWLRAQVEAKSELPDVERRIASVRILVTPTGAAVSLDGRALGAAAQAGPIEVDPGPHRVEAIANGRPVLERALLVPEGAKDMVVALGWDRAPHLGPMRRPIVSRRAMPPVRIAAIGCAAAGAALLATGIGTGVAAIAAHADLAPLCPDGACPAGESDALQRYHALGNSATAALAIGAALGATGLVLALLPGQRNPPRLGLSAQGISLRARW